MHECNAMQILETKKGKTQKPKNNGHKGKSNEAQGPRNHNSPGTQNHTNYLTKGFKLTSIKRFGENVDILTLSKNILKTHNLSFNKIPNEVIPNLNVLSLRMLNRILRYINSTRVITVNNHSILGYSIISQNLFYPKKL